MPRRHHDPRGEAGGRRAPRHHGRRHHRGRLPDRLQRRLRGGGRDRRGGAERHRRGAGARRPQGHRPGRRGGAQGQAPAHPHLHLHLARAHEIQAAEGARRGPANGDRVGDAGAQPRRGRGMVVRGRHPHRARLPVPLRRGRHQGRRHHDQHPRYGRLHRAGRVSRALPHGARARAERRQGDLLRPLPRRPRHGGGQFPGRPRGRRAPDRVHDQRHRRARRQRLARGDRHGRQDARRRLPVSRPASTPRSSRAPRSSSPT